MIKIVSHKCKFCDTYIKDIDHYISHLEISHGEDMPEGMDAWRFLYFLQTGKTHGTCIMCRKDTEWNNSTKKYARFCGSACKAKYRDIFKRNMIQKYGKVCLLNDPEVQRKMLANRSISGTYKWSDRIHTSEYTGSYELSFLEFLDRTMDFDPEDVMSPSPHNYYYQHGGKEHFYIPDFYIPSLNLEIEIKDGGDNPNNHHKIQEVDKEKERLKDEVMQTNGSFNYIKIVNKENGKFFDMLDALKVQFLSGDKKPVIML